MIRRLLEGVVIGVFSAFIVKLVDKYGNISFMKSLWQTFFVELWPIWIGLSITLVYWFIRLLVDLYKMVKTYRTLINWVEELENRLDKNLEPRINKLEKPGKLELLEKAMFPNDKEKV